MDMTLSKRGDYVMRSAIFLARAFDEGGFAKIREVVEETRVPRTFASQILSDLVRAGLASSKAGRDGGYQLTRPPREITALQVVEAAEGPLRSERCALGEGPCHWEAVCPLHETWSAATADLRELLGETTLETLVERDRAIEAGTYTVPEDSHRLHGQAVEVADVVQVELGLGALARALVRVAGGLDALVGTAAQRVLVDHDPAQVDGGDAARDVTASLVLMAAPDPAVRAVGASPDRSVDEAGPSRYLLSWTIGAGRPSRSLDAELAVEGIDSERSEVRVTGTWREDPGPPGPAAADAETGATARQVLRAFLRLLAGSCEQIGAQGPSGAGAPDTPARPRARSRLATARHVDDGGGSPG